MKRDEVIAQYQARIATNQQTKLTGDERTFLIRQFIQDLTTLENEAAIRDRCQQEIALLEEGYPKATIAKTRLNQYRSALEQAVKAGELILTDRNSKMYTYQKKKGAERTGEIGQAHHHYAWFYLCYDQQFYEELIVQRSNSS